MIELAINKLEKYLDSNKIFDDITFNIYDGIITYINKLYSKIYV